MPIPDQAIAHLLAHGYAVVPDFLSTAELSAAQADFLKHFPTADELRATPQRYAPMMEDPENLQFEFPFAGDALNHVSTLPGLIDLVERLLGTPDILLSQSAIWAKYAGTGDFEQGLHCDYQGNTLVVPRDDGAYRQVNMILYYSDVTPDLGPTHVVPLDHTRQLPPWPPFRTRKKHPELYRHELPILARAGTLLIFSMSTFHRAGEMTAEHGARFSHHLVYRGAAAHFNGYHQWSRYGENPLLSHFLEVATPRQREMLGFPRPGDPYWNAQTLAGVAARYPKMDMTPYRG